MREGGERDHGILAGADCSGGRGNAFAGIDWNKPFPAHKVIGNMYFVGSEQLGSFLIATPEGHILINIRHLGGNDLVCLP